jgi:hypothetical protein
VHSVLIDENIEKEGEIQIFYLKIAMATMLSAVKEILKYNINHMWVQKKKSKRDDLFIPKISFFVCEN